MSKKKSCCGASPRCSNCPKRKKDGKKKVTAVDRKHGFLAKV